METSFIERLQLVIALKKISQKDLSELINVDQGTVSRWRRKPPSVANIVKICQVLGCDFNWLNYGTGEPFPSVVQQSKVGLAHLKEMGVNPLAVMNKDQGSATDEDIDEEIKRLTEKISLTAGTGVPDSIKNKYPSEFSEEDERVFNEWFLQPRNVLTARLNKLLTKKFLENTSEKLATVAEKAVREMTESLFQGKKHQQKITAKQLPPEESIDSQATDYDLIEMSMKVIKSKTTYGPALKSNIRAFYQSVLNGEEGIVDRGDQTSNSDLLIMTSKVLESATLYRSALVSNILAFHQAVQGEIEMSEMRDEVAALRLEIRDLKEFIAAKFPEQTDQKREAQQD